MCKTVVLFSTVHTYSRLSPKLWKEYLAFLIFMLCPENCLFYGLRTLPTFHPLRLFYTNNGNCVGKSEQICSGRESVSPCLCKQLAGNVFLQVIPQWWPARGKTSGCTVLFLWCTQSEWRDFENCLFGIIYILHVTRHKFKEWDLVLRRGHFVPSLGWIISFVFD